MKNIKVSNDTTDKLMVESKAAFRAYMRSNVGRQARDEHIRMHIKAMLDLSQDIYAKLERDRCRRDRELIKQYVAAVEFALEQERVKLREQASERRRVSAHRIASRRRKIVKHILLNAVN